MRQTSQISVPLQSVSVCMCSSSGMNRIFSDWLCAPHTRDTDRIEWKEAVRRLGGQAQTILGSHTHPLAFALPLDPLSLPRLLYKNPKFTHTRSHFPLAWSPSELSRPTESVSGLRAAPRPWGSPAASARAVCPSTAAAPPDLQPHHPVHLAPVPGRGAAGLLCGLPAEGPVPGDTHQWESGDDGAEWPLRQLHRESTLPGATEQDAGGGTEPAEREGAQPSGGHLPGGAEGAPQAGGWPQRW